MNEEIDETPNRVSKFCVPMFCESRIVRVSTEAVGAEKAAEEDEDDTAASRRNSLYAQNFERFYFQNIFVPMSAHRPNKL